MRPLVAALTLLAATSAGAEWQADFFAGASHTPKSDMTLVVNTPAGPADHEFREVRWKNSLEVGARATYWLASVPWYGLGVDFAHFDADIPIQSVNTTIRGVTAPATLGAIDFSVFTLGLDLVRLRYRGTLQPYFAAGPALFRIKATNVGNPEMTRRPVVDTALGYKVGAGVSLALRKDLGLFTEFRYTHVKADLLFDSALSSSRFPLRFDLNTHHLVTGLSVSF